MLRMSDLYDRQKLKKYYRTSDMLNLLFFFPDISPIKDIVLVESEIIKIRHISIALIKIE